MNSCYDNKDRDELARIPAVTGRGYPVGPIGDRTSPIVVMVAQSRSGQLEHPHRRSAVEVLDFRHQGREARCLRATVADADGDVLLAVHAVGNRRVKLGTSLRRVSQSRLPVWSS